MKERTDRSGYIADDQIIELFWQRNEDAISETDKKYGAFLFRIAYNVLHDRLDCEECRNDTYLDVWNAIPPTKPKLFPAFIAQIIRRIAIDRYKQKTSKKRVPSEFTVSMEDIKESVCSREIVDVAYSAEEVGRIINEYVRKLPERQRYIFIERFYLSESVESIASDLVVSVPTVYRELDKIKQGLKSYLERNGVYI